MNKKKIVWLLSIAIMCMVAGILPMASVQASEEVAEEEVEFEYYTYTYHPEEKEYVSLSEYTGDKNVTEIVIPETIEGLPVRSLGAELFAGMENLQKVTIPASVQEFYKGVFQGCSSLTEIEGLQDDVEYNLVNAPIKETFADTPWYQQKAAEAENGIVMIGTTVYDLTSCSGKVVIPEGATAVPEVAWGSLYNENTRKTSLDITSISIPESMKDIGCAEQIAGLAKLKSVTVDSDNTVYYSKNGILFTNYARGIDEEPLCALMVCPAQKTGTTYKVPSAVDEIWYFRSKNITTITFASNYSGRILETRDYAFAGCTKLKKITLPTNCHLSNYVFKGTAITSLNIPKGLMATHSNHGVMAFSGMSKLQKITVNKNHSSYTVKNGALVTKNDRKELLLYPAAKSGTSFTIPAGIKTVYSLNEAKNLKTIVVPKSVKNIITSTKTMKAIRTIKYCGSKKQWQDVYVGGYYSDTGKHIGECTTKFTMYYNCKSLSNAKVTIPKSTYKYTGKNIKPKVTVKMNGTKLKAGTHYTVAYKNNKKAGKATITITGKGKYYGVRTKTFTIKK